MPVTVQIKTTAGRTAQISASYADTVADLKAKIERVTSIGCVRDLCCRGNVLDDDKTLADSGIEAQEVIIATVRDVAAARSTNPDPSGGEKASGSSAGTDHEAGAAGAGGQSRSRKKCFQCGAALNLVEQNMPCRCRGVFCERHRAYENHACSVNHAMLARAQLTQELFSSTAQSSTKGAASGRAQSAFVYNEFSNSHRQALSRSLHAVGFASLAVALWLSVGSEWDGVGVPTWIKRLLLGVTVSYSLSYLGHTRCPSEHGAVFCIWSSHMKTHPFQCIMCETRNLVRQFVDAATLRRTNRLTPFLERFKSFYDPLQ
jgi:hypothetical protein